MGQLAILKEDFEFLTKTNVTKETLAEHMGLLYDYALENYDCFLYETPFAIEFIPTKFMIINSAFTFFDEHRLYYGLNGHDDSILQEIEYWKDDGYELEQIVDLWDESRCYKREYNPELFEYEVPFMRDINKALNLFHMSYFKDILNDSPYMTPEHFTIEEWVNPPIFQVW